MRSGLRVNSSVLIDITSSAQLLPMFYYIYDSNLRYGKFFDESVTVSSGIVFAKPFSR
jgi:hypothetical protein